MKFTSKNSWDMRLNWGRRMEFQQELIPNSFLNSFPTNKNLRETLMNGFPKKHPGTTATKLRQQRAAAFHVGGTRRVLSNSMWWAGSKWESCPFLGESKIWGEHKCMKSMEDMWFVRYLNQKVWGKERKFRKSPAIWPSFGNQLSFDHNKTANGNRFCPSHVALRLSRESMTRQGKLEVPEISRGEVGWLHPWYSDGWNLRTTKSAAWSFWGSF